MVDSSDISSLIVCFRLVFLHLPEKSLTWLCLDIKVKPIEFDCLRRTNVERSNTSTGNPGCIVWPKGTPEEVCEIYTITGVVQVIIPSSSSEGKKEFSLGVLLAFIKSACDWRTIRPHLIVVWVGGVPRIAWAGVFWRCINGVGGHPHSKQPICLCRERVDEGDRDYINRLVIAVGSKSLLRTAGTLSKSAVFPITIPKHIPNTLQCFLSQLDYNRPSKNQTERTQRWPQPKIWGKTLCRKDNK